MDVGEGGQMTPIEMLKQLEQSTDLFVFADEIAPIIGVKPATLVYQAKHPNGNPLPFKFVVLGTRVHFNRLSFIEYVKGRKR